MHKFRVGDYVEYIGVSTPSWVGRCAFVDRVDSDGDTCVTYNGKAYVWCGDNIRKIAPPSSRPRAGRPAMPTIGGSMPRSLPTDSAARKEYPMFNGLLAYFPAALGHVSHHSFQGNEKHNPGQPLQHARGKSGDHEDCIVRHLVDAKEFAPGSASRIEELRACAWRCLALLQEECEAGGSPAAPAATFDAVP